MDHQMPSTPTTSGNMHTPRPTVTASPRQKRLRFSAEGLYAIGADGQMVYRGLYNLNTSGGHMATNIEGGRYSVRHALEHLFA